MRPETLEAIEAARDGAMFLLHQPEDGIAQSIACHLRCVADYLKRRELIATGNALLTLDPAGKDKWHYLRNELGGAIEVHFFSLPNTAALAPVLRVAAQGGFRRVGEVMIDREMLTVSWHLHDASGEHRFTIVGHLDSDKVACKRVQVGTKEVPVFETHCDEVAEEEFARLSEGANGTD